MMSTNQQQQEDELQMPSSSSFRGTAGGRSRTTATSTADWESELDTAAIAGLLVNLKHRSVTPEPQPSATVIMEEQQPPPQAICTPVQPSRHGSYNNSNSNASFGLYAPSSSSARSSPMPSMTSTAPLTEPPRLLSTSSPIPPATTSTSTSSSTSSSVDYDWQQLLDGSKLVLEKDRDLVPDALFVAMAQMKPCRLTHADRVGCYKTREIGFIGMACKHCGGQPGFGRYYPNSVRSLAQTTTSQTILKHIGTKCRFAPWHVRQAVLDLQQEQAQKEGLPPPPPSTGSGGPNAGRPRYGSRKIFFQRLWQRLHGPDAAWLQEEAHQLYQGGPLHHAAPASAGSVVTHEEEEGDEEDDHYSFTTASSGGTLEEAVQAMPSSSRKRKSSTSSSGPLRKRKFAAHARTLPTTTAE